MADTFDLWILAADRLFYQGTCMSLIVPTSDGEREILAHHSNMIAAIIPGMIRGRFPDGDGRMAAVSGGLVKAENNKVLVLVDSIERPEEIDANRARRAEEHAKEALLQKQSIQEYRLAQSNLARAVNRLKVKNRTC